MHFCAGSMAGLGLLLTADSQRYSFYVVVSSQQQQFFIFYFFV